MTRKDYIAFADMFYNSRDMVAAIIKTARIFKADNQRFQPYKFFLAAGLDPQTAAKACQEV